MKIITVTPPPAEPIRKIQLTFAIPSLKKLAFAAAIVAYVGGLEMGYSPIHWAVTHVLHPGLPGPTPPGPTPPGPTPPSPPGPAANAKVSRVLVLTDRRGAAATAGQLATLGGAKLWAKLDATCPPEGVGMAWDPAILRSADPSRRAWRYWDKDTDVSAESAAWQQAFTQAKAIVDAKGLKYPAIVVFTDRDPVAATVPETDDAALALFKNLDPGG